MENKLYEDRDENEIEINVMELLYVLKKKVWTVILAAVAGCMAASLYSVTTLNPVYTSTSMVYVLSKETTLTSLADLQIGSRLTKDYSVMITGRPVLEQAIGKQSSDLTYGQLKEKTTIANPTDTRILDMAISDEDPVRARTIVDEVAKALSDYIGDVMEMIPLEIMGGGVVPDKPISLNMAGSVALEGMAFAVISCATITLQVIMNSTIQSENDVSKYLGISVLAAIPGNGETEREQPIKFRGREKSRKKQRPEQRKKDRED